MSQLDNTNRTGIVDFEKFLQKTAQDRMISDAETRLREEQKAAEQRLNATCQRIENKIDDFIVETRTAIKQLDDKFEDKFERLDDKFEDKFERLEDKFERIDDRFERLEDKFERLEDKFDANKKWNIGIFITLILGFSALIGVVYFG